MLQGKWALVTGAAAGLGLAMAESLAAAGANIVLHDRLEPEQPARLRDVRLRILHVAGPPLGVPRRHLHRLLNPFGERRRRPAEAGDREQPQRPVPRLLPQVREHPLRVAFVQACQAATASNPLLLRELVGALVAAGVKPTAASAGAIPELGADAVSRFVLRRLARLPPDCLSRRWAMSPFLPSRPGGRIRSLAVGVLLAQGVSRSDFLVSPDPLLENTNIFPLGQYFWRVGALHGDVAGPWSSGATFNVVASPPTPPGLHLFSIIVEPG